MFRRITRSQLIQLAVALVIAFGSLGLNARNASAACAKNTYYRIISAWEVERNALHKGWDGVLVQYDQDEQCNRITTPYDVRDWTFDVNSSADESVPTVGIVDNVVWGKSAVIWHGTFWDPRARQSHTFKVK